MAERFLIFGHRGSPRRYPENTLASFDAALRAGADGFETDLRLLSDGTAVLYHDDECFEEEIETLSSAALAGRGVAVQPLADLAPYAERTTMILEVKRSKWEDVLLEQVTGWPNTILASFDHSLIEELARRKAGFPLGITIHGAIAGVAGYAARLGASWCFPNYRYVDREMAAQLHRKGIRTVPWTPNRPREWQHLYEIGCAGVITDVPEEAVAWRKEGLNP